MRELLAEKGFQFAEVTHEIKPVPGGPKLVHLTFDDGRRARRCKIREIEFVGNKAVSDGTLQEADEGQQGRQWLFSVHHRRAAPTRKRSSRKTPRRSIDYYRNHGYITARVGAARAEGARRLDGRQDALRGAAHPGHEGPRYRVGNFTFDGNKVVKTEGLRPLFKLNEGEFYSEKSIRKGLRRPAKCTAPAATWSSPAIPTSSPATRSDRTRRRREAGRPEPKTADGAPIVDVTMRMQEGEQYFVNRITFVGNTTTRDNVIRRELRLLEGGVFNTEALKYSVKRLNQLGYFKPLERPGNDASRSRRRRARRTRSTSR